ncbi:hypothetical protein [Nocardia sp. NPDC004722]
MADLAAERRTHRVHSELLDHLTVGTAPSATLLFSQSVREWQSTAEVYSDPDLARRLSSPFDPETDD